jgi:hypothetical protein
MSSGQATALPYQEGEDFQSHVLRQWSNTTKYGKYGQKNIQRMKNHENLQSALRWEPPLEAGQDDLKLTPFNLTGSRLIALDCT